MTGGKGTRGVHEGHYGTIFPFFRENDSVLTLVTRSDVVYSAAGGVAPCTWAAISKKRRVASNEFSIGSGQGVCSITA